MFRETRDKIISCRDALERGRDEGGCLYGFEGLKLREIGWRVGECRDGSGKNGKFAGDVKSIQIICGMRFLDKAEV